MSVAGDQLSAPILDDDERAESVVLQFENPLRMVERQGFAGKRHGLECHVERLAKTQAKSGRSFNQAEVRSLRGWLTEYA